MSLISLDIRMLRSLISVVETGSVTEAARLLGRTQPAITLQLQRLEELTGRPLMSYDNRRLLLSEHGTLVLSYAKSIVRLHDELLSRLGSGRIEGHVVIGTPDLVRPRHSAADLENVPPSLSAHSSGTALCALHAAGRPGEAR